MIDGIDEDLVLELSEVRASAEELQRAILQHNFLPDDFPTRQVSLLAESISGLSEGSLEGVKLPLEHAAVRISEIRRRFFLHSMDENNAEDRVFEIPSLERGDALDIKFSNLLSSIATALDAYREQARTKYESFNTQEYMEILPGFNSEEPGKIKIEKQISEIDQLSKKARDPVYLGDRNIDNFAISAADARNSLKSAQAEASSRFVIKAWMRNLTKLSADSLLALRKSINGISVAGGVAKEFYNRYRKSLSNLTNSVIEEAEEWLRFLSSQTEIAEKKLRQSIETGDFKHVGKISVLNGQRIIVSHDDMPFAISPNERVLPPLGSMVEFNIHTEDGKSFATNVVTSNQFIILNNALLTIDDAYGPTMNTIKGIMKKTKKPHIAVASLNKKATKSGILPTEFWKAFGYESLPSFATSSGEIFAYPDSENANFLSLKQFSVPSVTLKEVRDWAYDTLLGRGEGMELGVLAERASRHFSGGAVSIRSQLDVPKFSDIFKGDDRFSVSNGTLSVS